MLILTRKPGETIIIGDESSVTLLDIRGQQARIGISAPKHVSVHREEIYRRIQSEKSHNQKENLEVNGNIKPENETEEFYSEED